MCMLAPVDDKLLSSQCQLMKSYWYLVIDDEQLQIQQLSIMNTPWGLQPSALTCIKRTATVMGISGAGTITPFRYINGISRLVRLRATKFCGLVSTIWGSPILQTTTCFCTNTPKKTNHCHVGCCFWHPQQAQPPTSSKPIGVGLYHGG